MTNTNKGIITNGINKNVAVCNSSVKQDWATPRWLFDILNMYYGFDHDPCPDTRADAVPLLPRQRLVQDGLQDDWGRCNYVNPPYGRMSDGSTIADWIKKGIMECTMHDRSSVFLIPCRLDSKIWQEILYHSSSNPFPFAWEGWRCSWASIPKRIRFVGAKDVAPFTSALVHIYMPNGPGHQESMDKSVWSMVRLIADTPEPKLKG